MTVACVRNSPAVAGLIAITAAPGTTAPPGSLIVPVNVPLVGGGVANPSRAGEEIIDLQVRFRTVGDISCTAPVESDADDVSKIVFETATTTITERGATRLDDQTSDASMEQRKKEGYF